MKLSFRDTIL